MDDGYLQRPGGGGNFGDPRDDLANVPISPPARSEKYRPRREKSFCISMINDAVDSFRTISARFSGTSLP